VTEAARLRTPELVELVEADAQRRVEISAEHDRVLDMYQSGIIDRGDRDRRLAALADRLNQLDNTRRIAAVPSIEWSWPPERINVVLAAMWVSVELDSSMQPVRAEWRVPEWRSETA